MQATEFAKTHKCDADWVLVMGKREFVALEQGQHGTYSGFPATVLRHYHNGMYEVSVRGDTVCISGSEFVPK